MKTQDKSTITIAQIKAAILKLSKEEFTPFLSWFYNIASENLRIACFHRDNTRSLESFYGSCPDLELPDDEEDKAWAALDDDLVGAFD